MTHQDPSGARGDGRGARVVLLSMPVAALEWPAIGISLLQAGLHRRGTPCDIRYFTFLLADMIGLADYQWLCHEAPYAGFAGDWVFAESLYGPDPERDERFLHDVLRRRWQMTDTDLERLRGIRAKADPFLDRCLQAVAWADADVVGFTSTFQQNIASLALARRIKDQHPAVRIVFGGANWDGEMGIALHEQFPFVDIAVRGEADLSFPLVVAALADGGGGLDAVPGLVYRAGAGSVATAPGAPIRDLDELPVPDFSAYFADRAASSSSACVDPVLLIETGRGCWWGEKHHCTFCGLNGSMMTFRSKTPERVLEEIAILHDRSGVSTFSVVDNILDMRYFRELLPRLAELPLEFSWEVKANLTHEQVRQLAAAHVGTIQPGIESLSDTVLALMDKGTTMMQNVQLLKWCREHGVHPAWNLLFGFPGEQPDDYAEQYQVITRIWHLDPPSGWGPVRMDRFSPYFDDPAAYGLTNVRPMAPYPLLYPFEPAAVMRIASYFDFDYADGRDPWTYVGPLIELVTAWQKDPHRGAVTAVDRGADLVLLDDTIAGHRRRAVLRGWKADAYRACDRVRKPAALLARPGLDGVGLEELVAFLDRCVDAGFMISNRGAYLGLALGAHDPAEATEPRVAARPLLPIAE